MTGSMRWSRAASPWDEADVADLVAYRNRMLKQPSAHTGRPYSVRTINHRVRGVIRFYTSGRFATRGCPASPLARARERFLSRSGRLRRIAAATLRR